MSRDELVAVVADAAATNGAALFAGNGSLARSLSTLHDRDDCFYMVGSMGLCSAIAAGFANRSGAPVIALEGDGNTLMGLSGLPAVAKAASGALFVHVVADNGQCETTGGQMTLSGDVDFGALALAAGYDARATVTTVESLTAALAEALRGGRTLIHAEIEVGVSPKHPRPVLEPVAIAARFLAEAASRSWSRGGHA